MAGFVFKLEHEDGTPADPPTFHTAVPNWQAGRHHPTGPRQDSPRHQSSARQRSGRRPGARGQASFRE
jgi:hypothetical protein